MNAPFFWWCLAALLIWGGIVLPIIKALHRRDLQRRQIELQHQVIREKQRTAEQCASRPARTATKRQPSFTPIEQHPVADGRALCETCSDPNHYICSGEAECECCQHTLDLATASSS